MQPPQVVNRYIRVLQNTKYAPLLLCIDIKNYISRDVNKRNAKCKQTGLPKPRIGPPATASKTPCNFTFDKNSSGDEIANVNFFYNIAHVEASAYAH